MNDKDPQKSGIERRELHPSMVAFSLWKDETDLAALAKAAAPSTAST